jgi:hypothetical protein
LLLFAASAASSVLRSKTLKLTGFTPGNLSQIGGPRRIRDSLGCGTERQKSASVPGQWDESACLRGATHVRRDVSSCPLCSCYGERAVDVSIPAGRAVFPGFRSVGRFQPGASFSVRRMAWYSCSVIAVLCHCIQHNSIPNCPQCQPFAAQNREIQGQISHQNTARLFGQRAKHEEETWGGIEIANELQKLTSLGG